MHIAVHVLRVHINGYPGLPCWSSISACMRMYGYAYIPCYNTPACPCLQELNPVKINEPKTPYLSPLDTDDELDLGGLVVSLVS